MGVRERLVQGLMTRGFDTLQERLNIPELQERFNAFSQRVMMVRIVDIDMPPLYIQVSNGKIHRSFDYDGKPDGWIAFRTLNGLLNVLDGNYTIREIFAWDGEICVDGKMIKEVKFEGDWYKESIILTEILENYLEIIRHILHNEMKLVGYAIKGYAKMSEAFAPANADWDEF